MNLSSEELTPIVCYKLMSSLIIPRPIAWITTRNEDGGINAAPFSFFNGVAATPPTVAVSIARRRGRGKDTTRNIEREGVFVINLVDRARLEAMNRTATEYPYGVSEPEVLGLPLVPMEPDAPARLADTVAALSCRLERIIPVGDPPVAHILGRIRSFYLHEDLPWLPEEGVPPEALQLIGRMGQDHYTGTTADLFALPRVPYIPPEQGGDTSGSPAR